MKKGDNVTIVVLTPICKTEESGVIDYITESDIYLINLNLPFDKKTGFKRETFGGVKVFIKEIVNKSIDN